MNTLLEWVAKYNTAGHQAYQEAQLGRVDDGVLFQLSFQPTCYRRGQFQLWIEVCSGEHHYDWGCFDASDQPIRYYHSEDNAKDEAEAIAQVLWADRQKRQPLSAHPH